MKNLIYLFIIVSSACFMSCSGGEKASESTAEEAETEATPEEAEAEGATDEIAAVSIWENISVKETPVKNGKWITSVAKGESVVFLNETQIDSDDKDREYMKIRLKDGKEGWTRSDFIVANAKAAVFKNDAELYKRPDLLTKADKKFSKMDIVAVKQQQGDWLEIAGKRADGKWIDKGWIKQANLSYDEVDLAVAKSTIKAMAEDNEEKILEGLNAVLEDNDLSTSIFISDIQSLVDEMASEEALEEVIDEVVSEENASDSTEEGSI
ncbi:MAG: hypothetical protein AAFX87_29505 [Bacteroidota bacterium]